jgi:hypothetical protein
MDVLWIMAGAAAFAGFIVVAGMPRRQQGARTPRRDSSA